MLFKKIHYFSKRNTIILLLLGFASGLPLALTAGSFQAWIALDAPSVDIKTIGFLTLVGQAYVFKFLWAPLMDRFTPGFLGRRRGWLLITQLLLVITIFAMGCLSPQKHLFWLACLAALVAIFSASQDIVFDAYKTDQLSPEERGSGSAISVLGYRIAMIVSGGIALWLATTYLSWQMTYWLMAGFMLIGILGTYLATEDNKSLAPKTLEDAIVIPWKDFFNRNNVCLILLLLVLYKFGDTLGSSLSTIFLLHHGFSGEEIAFSSKIFGLLATIIGALVGGIVMQHLSLFKSLVFFGVLQAISNFGYWYLAITEKNIIDLSIVIFIENLCGGMGTIGFVALLMTLCNKSFSATQFALLSALSAVSRVFAGPVAGWLVKSYDWPQFYLITVVAALPGLFLLVICKQTIEYAQVTGLFKPRIAYKQGYSIALLLVKLGILLLIISLLLLGLKYFVYWHWLQWQVNIFYLSIALFILAAMLGGTLDFLSMKKEKQMQNLPG